MIALSLHLTLLVFATPRIGSASRQGAGGLVFLVLCFGFATWWVALDGGSASPLNMAYVMPLTVAVLRAPRAAPLLTSLAIAAHLLASAVATSLSGSFDLATSLVWMTQFVLAAVMTAWIATARINQRQRMRELTAELHWLATHDPLTRVLNRRGLEVAIGAVGDGPRRRTTALLVADLDHFKRVNDEHGHAAGDDALVEAARAIRRAIREGDLVARTGGEEFTIALFGTSNAEALDVAERVRSAIADDCSHYPVTASVGLAMADGRELLDLHRDADRAMYRAKRLGRDRVVVAS